MTTQLARIAEKAEKDRKVQFTSLAHVLTPDFMKETWSRINKRGASGIDGETTMDFERNLTERVEDLYSRLRAGRYRAPPVRRVEIPKAGGKIRALGIPTVEDRLLQAAVARILSAVFEPNFSDSSYGYRPKRNAHDALKALRGALIAGNVMQIFEADIRAYVDRINHEWLRKMLAQRIADPVILRLIDKWLRAGVMAGGVVMRNDEGVPQGGPISRQPWAENLRGENSSCGRASGELILAKHYLEWRWRWDLKSPSIQTTNQVCSSSRRTPRRQRRYTTPNDSFASLDLKRPL